MGIVLKVIIIDVVRGIDGDGCVVVSEGGIQRAAQTVEISNMNFN